MKRSPLSKPLILDRLIISFTLLSLKSLLYKYRRGHCDIEYFKYGLYSLHNDPTTQTAEQLASDLIENAYIDQNGSLSDTELAKFLHESRNLDAETATVLFADLDTDNDSTVTKAEVSEALLAVMQQMHAERLQHQGMQLPPPSDSIEATASLFSYSDKDKNSRFLSIFLYSRGRLNKCYRQVIKQYSNQ